jgi:cyclic pyranopterin phosphate synthase
MLLQDHYQRRIDYLRISVTDRCNLSCFYCRPQAERQTLSHETILSYEEILRMVSVAVPLGISRVRVTGGEPLVRRGIAGFIASLRNIGGIEDISLTTNGVLLEETAEALLAAGKPRLNISLDSLKPERFLRITGKDCWEKVWRGIHRVEELGFFPIKINVVPVKGVNEDEVVDFARLTLDRRFHVRFIEFMPIGANERWNQDACVSSDWIRKTIEQELGPLAPFASGTSGGPAINYQIPGAQGVIGFISPVSRHFCKSCRRLRLTSDGKIRPCLLSDTEIDIKSPMRGGCDDQELVRLLKLALAIKPERHYIEDAGEMGTGCSRRAMFKIGG